MHFNLRTLLAMQSSLKTHYSVDFIKAYSVDDTYYLVFCSYFDSVCIWIKMPFVQGLWKCFGGVSVLKSCLTPLKLTLIVLKTPIITLSPAEVRQCNLDILVQGNSVVSMIAALLVVIIWGPCLLYYPQEYDKN